ncbi:hypothetical protein M0802_010839 [Mischocyttarus mexicanus]|nr:hypothetical protein M0802_010839 [Mischocyttarus mexicanus]
MKSQRINIDDLPKQNGTVQDWTERYMTGRKGTGQDGTIRVRYGIVRNGNFFYGFDGRLRSKNRTNTCEYSTEDEECEINEDSTIDEDSENVNESMGNGKRRYLSQDTGTIVKRNNVKIIKRNALSQGSSSDRFSQSYKKNTKITGSKSISVQDELDLAGRVIRYIFAIEKKKHFITKSQIIKNVLQENSKNFHVVIERVKLLLSQVFGYKLVNIDSSKYIVVNEIENSIPHLNFSKPTKSEQVLLFLILCHIYMYEDACTEEIIWDFLRHLEIVQEDNFEHSYFGNVKRLITVEFVAQQYLKKEEINKGDSLKCEYKWGPRAEYEVSYRDVLKFVSKMFGDIPINSWPSQYKKMLQKEQSNKT